MKSERRSGLFLSVAVFVAAALSLVVSDRGTVDEAGAAAPISTPGVTAGVSSDTLLAELEDCESNGPDGCVLAWAEKALELKGASAAVQLVSGSTNPTLQRSCHGVMHELGRLSGNGKPLSEVQDVIKAGEGVCQFGFQHGVLIGVSESIESDEEFITLVKGSCDGFPKTGNTYSSCVHGIGHAVSTRHPDDLDKAGSLCAALGELVGWCASGAVMEWGASSAEALSRSKGGPSKATATCDSFRSVTGDVGYKECVREMPAIMFAGQTTRQDIATWCRAIGDASVKEACADGLGFTFGTEMTVTTETVGAACTTLGDARYIGRCASSAGGMYYQRDVVRNKVAAEAVCAALPESARKVCDEHLSQTFTAVTATVTS